MTIVKEPQKAIHFIARALRNPHLWVSAVILTLLVVIHYHEFFTSVSLLDRIGSILGLGLTRQTFGRILFLIPVAYGAATLGMGGGLSILVLAATAMLPRVFLISFEPREALFETYGIIFTGALLVTLFDTVQKGKRRLSELETTQNMLNLQIKRLGMLYAISNIVSQSLEAGQVLNTAIDKVRQLIGSEASWLYLWDEGKNKLRLAVSSGLSESSLPEALELGEGLDGRVAQSGQPTVVEDMSSDPIFNASILRREGLQSILVFPLVFKGETIGTLGVGARSVRHFPLDEVDLFRAIGDQISIAVENTRLYEKERLVAEALRISERNYRELFENASDAIWVHDLNGNILTANSAFERLAGYERANLIGANVSLFLPLHDKNKIDRELHNRVLRGEHVETIEQELIKKDGSTVIVQMGTSLIMKDGAPWAFQHIARDITEEKRTHENLRFYVQQVTEAQEAERKRIARELHDETAQALVAVSRNLDDLASNHSQVSIRDVREQVRSILQEVRQFSQRLRPSILDDLGLLPALKWLATDLTKNYNITADIEVIGNQRSLPTEAELMLFRITQEALTNVRRHSGAKQACVRVEFADGFTKVTVRDNGSGFEMPARTGDLARIGKLGLAGMQERAQLLGGTLTIDSKPGKGTTLIVGVPL